MKTIRINSPADSGSASHCAGIVARAKLIVCDEPYPPDVSIQAQVINLLIDLQRKNASLSVMPMTSRSPYQPPRRGDYSPIVEIADKADCSPTHAMPNEACWPRAVANPKQRTGAIIDGVPSRSTALRCASTPLRYVMDRCKVSAGWRSGAKHQVAVGSMRDGASG